MHEDCQCLETQLQPEQHTYLKKIGLSRDAIRLYEILQVFESLDAQEAAFHTGTFASAKYRLFEELESRGLIRRLPGRPRRYKALALNDGMQASFANQEKQLKDLVLSSGHRQEELVALVVGRQKTYDEYIRFANKAQKQICIYAIGIAYSKELSKTQADAIKRGVSIRHVVQEVKAANYFVISRWLQLGIVLRSLKRSRGYHLITIDDTRAIVTFSNPTDTEERVSLLTTNKATISLMQAQFETIWTDAKPIKPISTVK